MRSKNKTKYWVKNDLLFIFLMFCYLFFFKMPRLPILSVLDSAMLVGAFLLLLACFDKYYRSVIISCFNNKKIIFGLSFCLFLICYAFLLTSFKTVYDYSIIRTLFHQFINIVIGILFFAYLIYSGKTNKLLEYIVICYCIQTVIQYTAFIIPGFGKFTDIFKSNEVIELKKAYDGFRLNAISGSVAFSLAVGYSIVTLLFLIRWDNFKGFGNYKKAIIFYLLILGGITAGRTAIVLDFVGIICILILKLFKFKGAPRWSNKEIAVFFKVSFVTVVIVFLFATILLNAGDYYVKLFNTFKVWLSKGVSEYFGIGENTTGYNFFGSSYSVFGKIGDILFGDGKWVNSDGSYYLHQDAGYVRIIGFGGIIWLIFIISFQLCFLCFHSKQNIKYGNAILLLILLIATLKADCIGISIQHQLIFVLIYMYDIRKGEFSNGRFANARNKNFCSDDCLQSLKCN